MCRSKIIIKNIRINKIHDRARLLIKKYSTLMLSVSAITGNCNYTVFIAAVE